MSERRGKKKKGPDSGGLHVKEFGYDSTDGWSYDRLVRKDNL